MYSMVLYTVTCQLKEAYIKRLLREGGHLIEVQTNQNRNKFGNIILSWLIQAFTLGA